MRVNTMRRFPSFMIITGFVLMFAQCSKDARTPGARPGVNVVIFSIDTLRADHLGCYRYSRSTSPMIDEFSLEAVLFEKANAPAPYTAPAHMSIFTGLMPEVHAVSNHMDDGTYSTLSKDIKTLPQKLKEEGYLTAAFVGGAQIAGHLGFDRGFDIYSDAINWGDVYYRPDSLSPIKTWIEKSKDKRQPLFLFLHNYLCHDPYIFAPIELRKKFFKPKVQNLPIGIAAINKQISPPTQFVWERLQFNNKNSLEGFNTARENFWSGVDMSNPDHREAIVSLYDSCVSYADYVFGEVIKTLKKEGMYENSLIILTSDHGEEFYEHQTIRHGSLFKETIHVPLIIKFPSGTYASARISDQVRTMDLAPTILDYLNVRQDYFMQGSSFMSLLRGERDYDPAIVSTQPDGKIARLTKGNFVYTNQPCPMGNEWLFFSPDDPNEQRNVAEMHPQTVREMKQSASLLSETDDRLKIKYAGKGDASYKANEKTLEQLKALGYLN